MSFQPFISAPGLAGWRFLKSTYDAQFSAFSGSERLKGDEEYFIEKIAEVKSASHLVGDRRLLLVSLGAFGLEDDLNNRAFIQKVLEDGTTSRDALSNKLADERYKRLSASFGFGPGETIETAVPEKMQEVLFLQKRNAFEAAVGEQDDTMRIALFAQHELQTLAQKNITEDAKWFSIMALPPLRSMFETALGLPAAFGQIDIDKQLEILKEKTFAVAGSKSIAQFSDSEKLEQFTNRFLARAQIETSSARLSNGAVALILLQSMPASSG